MIYKTEESWLDFKQVEGSLYSVNVHPDSGLAFMITRDPLTGD